MSSENPNMPTGEIEVYASELEVLSEAAPLPFQLAAVNEAQENGSAATQAELRVVPKRVGRSREIYAMIDSAGDVKNAIRQTDPAELQRLFRTGFDGGRGLLLE